MDTAVVDSLGCPLTVFHGTKARILTFDNMKTVDGGFHFGTQAQAKMRVGSGFLVSAKLDVLRPRRSRDMGGRWKLKISSAISAGYDGIVYLNRYEGISRETVEKAYSQRLNLDSLTDARFRKFAPEARDSWIAFFPEQIRVLAVTRSPSLG